MIYLSTLTSSIARQDAPAHPIDARLPDVTRPGGFEEPLGEALRTALDAGEPLFSAIAHVFGQFGECLSSLCCCCED